MAAERNCECFTLHIYRSCSSVGPFLFDLILSAYIYIYIYIYTYIYVLNCVVTPLQQACGSLVANEINSDFVTLWLLCSVFMCVFSRACGFCPPPELYMFSTDIASLTN